MNEGFNNVEGISNNIIESAVGKVLGAGGSRELTNEIYRARDPRLLFAIGALAFTLVACQSQAGATTPEQKNPENSNDPTTSEQVPMIDETKEDIESYDEVGDVPVGEFVFTPTPTLDMDPIKTPTEAPTPTPTFPPLIEGGDVEDITENMEEGDVLWSIFELQKIVNGYSRGSSGTFSEYISEVRESLPDEDKYSGLSNILIKLEKFERMGTMSLIYSLKDSFPDLILMDIPEGYNSIIEALPEDLRKKMVEFGDNVKKGTNQSYFVERIYDGRALVAAQSKYELGTTYPGIIIMDGIGSVDAPAKLITVIPIVGQIEKNGKVYPVGLMLNEQKRLVFIILSDEKAAEIFSGNYSVTLVADSVLSDHGTK